MSSSTEFKDLIDFDAPLATPPAPVEFTPAPEGWEDSYVEDKLAEERKKVINDKVDAIFGKKFTFTREGIMRLRVVSQFINRECVDKKEFEDYTIIFVSQYGELNEKYFRFAKLMGI